MIRNMTIQSDLLGTAMQASVMRNDVILNNIANADTPGFKKSIVVFEEAFQNALGHVKRLSHTQPVDVKPRVQRANTNFSQRLDGNNVNIELEMVDLYQNAMRYETMANSVISSYRRIGLVTKSR